MTLEVVNTIASIATLLAIAATAIAALGQLRHMRGSNQMDLSGRPKAASRRRYLAV